MSTRQRLGILFLGLAAACLGAAPARAVAIAVGSGAGVAGQNVDIAITTGSVSNIYSWQFDIQYNASVITATDVIEAGTLTGNAGWGNSQMNVTTNGGIGHVTVSNAFQTPLSGTGTLVIVRFTINPAQLTASSSNLTMTGFTYNEGSPTVTTTNGLLTINATPIITVAPNTGEIVRGQTLNFTVSGSVSNPVTWSTTNGAIATITSPGGVLTGVAPGSVRVHAVDNAGHADDSDGDILIRGMGLTVGAPTVVVGQQAAVPLTVTSLAGLGVLSGQITLTFSSTGLTATGITTPAGTLMNTTQNAFGSGPGTCSIAFVSNGAVTGSGVLCYVTFATNVANVWAIQAPTALFNETLPAKVTNGQVTANALPTIVVNPDAVTLLAGQTQQFNLLGSPTPPILWSTLDPSVATINGSGLLTAVAGGVTMVHAVDNVGAQDNNTSVTVYDFAASLPTVLAPPGSTARMPIKVDRSLAPLHVRSVQYQIGYSTTYITQARALGSGLVGPWAPGGIVTNPTPGVLRVADAGVNPLPSGVPELQILEFDIAPGTPVGTNIPVTLSAFICNEGHPSAQITSGTIQVRTTTDVAAGLGLAFALGPPVPNPANGECRVRYSIPIDAEHVSLAVYGVDGRRVATLIDGPLSAGDHDARWNGRDAGGALAPTGLYFMRLEWGGRQATQKLARIR